MTMRSKIVTYFLICMVLISASTFVCGDAINNGKTILPSHSALPNPNYNIVPLSLQISKSPGNIQGVSFVPSVTTEKNQPEFSESNESLYGNMSVIERRPFAITDEMLAEWEQGAKKSSIQPSLTTSDSGAASKSLLSYMPWSSYSTRDQGSAGNCWVWASTAVTEIDHTIDTGIKDILSIGWLVRYYNNGGACANNGGQMINFNDFYTGSYSNPSSMKFIPWSNSNAGYKDSTTSGCPQAYSGTVTSAPNYPVSSMSFYTLDPYGGTYTNSAAIAWIKGEINANRACAFVMGWPTAASWSTFTSYWNTNSGTYNPDVRKTAGYTSRSGHVMTIVGYDDVSRYWVVLNSWGTNAAHPSGTFRMNMDMDYTWELNGNRYSNFWTGRHTINWAPTGVTLKDKLGVSRGGRNWYLDYNGNGAWNGPSTDRQYGFGLSGDKPISGDWWGYGKSNIGVFRPTTRTWYLDKNGNGKWDGAVTDATFAFGLTSDLPVSGKWRTTSYTDIGVFRSSTRTWYLDYNSNMKWDGTSLDRAYTFGLSGDKPVSGDWDNDGLSEIGVFRPSTRTWYLDYNGNGKWDGTSLDRAYTFGLSGDIPVTGDWNNNGITNIGVFRPTTRTWYLDYSGNGAWGTGDKSYTYGLNGDAPVTGDWKGSSASSISGSSDKIHPF